MHLKGNYNLIERRRWTAIDLQTRKGLSIARVAKRMKINRSSIYRWNKLYQEKGSNGLRAKEIPRRPGKLTSDQESELSYALEKKSDENKLNYAKNPITINTVRDLIKEKYNVSYSTAHIWKLLKRLHWQYEPPYISDDDKKRKTKFQKYRRGSWRKKFGW